MKAGLLHPNCRHTLAAYFPGITVLPKVPDKDKVFKTYEAEQKQRTLERKIRKAKRKAAGACDQDNVDAALTEMEELQKRLREHLERYPELRREYNREKIRSGLDQSNNQVKALENKEQSGILKSVETIHKSVGAKAKNYNVLNPVTGDIVHLAEGTRITQPKNHVMAGKGRERRIDCLDWLVDRFGGKPEEWTKEKGFGYILDEYGEEHKVELHWYQNPETGKVEMKMKEQPGGGFYIDED